MDQVTKKLSTYPGKVTTKNEKLLADYVHRGKQIPIGLGLDEAEKLALKYKLAPEIAGVWHYFWLKVIASI